MHCIGGLIEQGKILFQHFERGPDKQIETVSTVLGPKFTVHSKVFTIFIITRVEIRRFAIIQVVTKYVAIMVVGKCTEGKRLEIAKS